MSNEMGNEMGGRGEKQFHWNGELVMEGSSKLIPTSLKGESSPTLVHLL